MTRIHPTALIDPRAQLEEDVEVGAYSIIGRGVKVGKGTRIRSHVVIEGNTTLGRDNAVFEFATLGNVPQDLKYKGEDSQLILGSRNIIREYASLHLGTQGGGMLTLAGDGNCLMM